MKHSFKSPVVILNNENEHLALDDFPILKAHLIASIGRVTVDTSISKDQARVIKHSVRFTVSMVNGQCFIASLSKIPDEALSDAIRFMKEERLMFVNDSLFTRPSYPPLPSFMLVDGGLL